MNDKKSTSDEEEDDESLSDTIETPTNFLSSIENSKSLMSTSNYSSTVEFNHIQESFARNVILVDEPLTDVKRQISRYDILHYLTLHFPRNGKVHNLSLANIGEAGSRLEIGR